MLKTFSAIHPSIAVLFVNIPFIYKIKTKLQKGSIQVKMSIKVSYRNNLYLVIQKNADSYSNTN